MITKDSAATLRPDIAAAVHEYDIERAARRFIGRRVLPVFESVTDTGEYAVFKRENVLETPDTARKEDGGYNRMTGQVGSNTFTCEEHGLEHRMDDRKARKYSRYFDYEAVMARTLWYKILMAHERRVATLTATLTGGNAATSWATITTANPDGDVETAANAVADACGADKMDLSLIVSRTDFGYLRNNAVILARIKYTNPGVSKDSLTAQILAELFGIKEVLVGRGGYNIKAKGVTPSISQVWPAGFAYLALLCEDEKEPLESPCLGRTILWTDDSPELPVTETYRAEDRRGTILRVRCDVDEILQAATSALFGYKIDVDVS